MAQEHNADDYRFILPLLGEYVDSGYREPKARLLYSLRSNGRYQAMVLGAGSVGAVYFVLSEGFNFTSLKGLVMALAYAWGLILAIYLMGHGLVAIPRRLYRDASTSRRLRKIQSQAPKTYEQLMDASDELHGYEQQVSQLQQRKNGTARNFQEWIHELADMAALPDTRVSSIGSTLPSSRPPIPQVITERFLADLTRQLKRTRHKKLRYMTEWNGIITSAIRAQTIIDAAPSQKLTFSEPSLMMLTPTLRYHLHAHFIPALCYTLSGFLSIASAAIVWSELSKSFFPHQSLVSRTILPTSAKNVTFFPSQIFAAFWITYMSTSALYSITVLPLWGNRALVHRTTYEESASWYAAQVAKLTVPLAYNFLTFLPEDVQKGTMFYRFLGELVNLTPLGRGFSGYFPILLLVPIAAALFGLYGRVKNLFGFGDLLEEDDADTQWREGKILIEREIRTHGTTGLGLSPRAGSLDLERNATVNLPPFSGRMAGVASSAAASAAASRPSRPTRNERRPLVSIGDDDGDDTSFFSDFGRRVKNTFENIDRPNWFGGNDGDGRNASGSGSGPWDWGKMFGGSREEGRLRL